MYRNDFLDLRMPAVSSPMASATSTETVSFRIGVAERASNARKRSPRSETCCTGVKSAIVLSIVSPS